MTSIRALIAAAAIIALTSPTLAADHSVEVINKTGLALKHYYASVTNTSSWEEDILGKDVLDDGESFTADIDDGSGKCHFDFKAVFANGAELVHENIDVCTVATYTYTR